MGIAAVFRLVCGVLLSAALSLQLLNSISTICRPIVINNYHSNQYDNNIINHIQALSNISQINNHSSSPDDSIRTRAPQLVPALFAFGDSTVDPGNNNHLITISRSNFAPYGRDLALKKPTGRFCNGMLVTDYIALIIGLQPRMVPYLDMHYGWKKENRQIHMPLQLEVSFASASSGFYESTARHFNAMSLHKQLDHFKEYRQRLSAELGQQKALEILGKAIFIISTGTNDYLNNYFLNPYLRSKYSLPQFQNILLDLCAQFIKEMYELGARRIGVVSLPPFGCLPAIRTLYRRGDGHGCVEHLNQLAIDFNQELQGTIFPSLQHTLVGLHLAYMDSHSVLLDIVNNPSTYGLKQAHKACCGSGKLEVGIFCNKLSIGTCQDATSYAFWDSFHPTDWVNQILATKLVEQVWRVFEMNKPSIYHHYKHASVEVLDHARSLEVPTKKWRWKMFLLGGFFYSIHLFRQFFPKMIDLGF